MKPIELARELVYPATHVTVLLPLIISWLLFSLAAFFGIFGLYLFLVTLVPFLRYLMRLLEARSHGRDAPSFEIEWMALVGDVWTLFPALTVGALIWVFIGIDRSQDAELFWLAVVVAACVLPASLAVLGLTRSPIESLNPVALFKLIVATGLDYLWLVLILVGFGALLVELNNSDMSRMVFGFIFFYFVFLTYSLTGAITSYHELAAEVDIPEPVPVPFSEQEKRLAAGRQKIANHAYGFASRGNRQGAFAHIQSEIAREEDVTEATVWYFNEMLRWDTKDAALFFAQTWLTDLLATEQDVLALKVLSQCLYANPVFRPLANDREAVDELLQRYGRDDLTSMLR